MKQTIRKVSLLIVMVLVCLGWWSFRTNPDQKPGHVRSDRDLTIRDVTRTDDPGTHSLLRKAAQAKPVTDEEQARFEKWKSNFPFKPLYHPTLKHDPSIYDPKKVGLPDWPKGVEASIIYDVHSHLTFYHGYLAAFHENPNRYSKEFEQLYHLLGEFDRNDNAVNVAKIFQHLIGYQHAKQKDPHRLVTRTIPVYNEVTEQFEDKAVPLKDKPTWGSRVDSYREGIAFVLYQENQWPAKKQMEPERSWELADYIIDSFPPDAFLKFVGTEIFAFFPDYEKDLKPGDPILIPKKGYAEAYEKYVRKSTMPIWIDESEDSPQVLVRGEDGKFYDKATGEEFMPEMPPMILKGNEILSKDEK